MKKILLSLFILPLIFIGNFSSAYLGVSDRQLVYFGKPSSQTSNSNTYTYSFTPGTYYISLHEDYPEDCPLSVYKSFQLRGCNNGDVNCFNSSVSANFNGLVSFTIDKNYTTLRISKTAGCRATLNLYKDVDKSLYDEGLTPIVSGLKDTFVQLVPLIVYLGIGLLLVTLGFVIVRWLLNWMGIKINSIFKSKRG